MNSILNRVFGRNIHSPSFNPNSNRSPSNTISVSTSSLSSPTLVPLDLLPWIPPEFNRDNIRLLVFSDSDDTGLELIFDSKTLRVVVPPDPENVNQRPTTTTPGRPSMTRPSPTNPLARPPMGPSGGGSAMGGSRARPAITRFTYHGKEYELLKSSNDIRMYADYIFGVMPLLFKGTGMKVHTSQSPLQIMMSRVFPLKVPEKPENLMPVSAGSESETPSATPMSPYSPIHRHSPLSSGASIVSSTISSILLNEDLTNNNFGRLYRRWLKCVNKSMKQPKKQPGRRHRRCIGAAFIVTFPSNDTGKYKHFQEFFCTHAPLIENHFQKIMSAAETHINDRNAIPSALLDKLFSFKDELYNLYTRPRLLYPAWYLFTQEHITMSKRRALAQQLCSIMDYFLTPKYGDFLNCVLSAVLSYQLSWLSTVSPSLAKSKQQFLFKSKAEYTNSLQSFLQYSPLWGQLLDLYSAYEQPPYICRTVLVGSDSALLNRLLYLLSFFIRPSYLTYQIPNTNLSDTNDEKRTYKKIRLYIDELIANSMPIHDIDPYSPVASIHSDDDKDDFERAMDDPDDIDILFVDESSDNHHHSRLQSTSTEFYQLTFTSDDLENLALEDPDVSQVLESLVQQVDQNLLEERRSLSPKVKPSPSKVPNLVTTAPPPTGPNKTLMSLSLFEPNHLGHESNPINNDYHLDLALSLISSVSSSYSSDFVLQAIETKNPSEILRSIVAQHNYDVQENGCLFLNGETLDASITILINLDDHSVNLYSSKHQEIARRQERTKLVQPILDHIRLMKQFLPADFVLLNMEDSLQEIYFQALAVLKYIHAQSRSIYSQESVNSLGDSASSTSVGSSETDEQRSLATNHTVTDLPSSMMESSYSNVVEHSSELVQNLLRKFQLQRSDYLFLKNILRILEIEQREING